MARPKLKDMIACSEEYLKKQHDRWDNNIKLYRGEITRFRTRVMPQWAHVIEVNLTRPVIDAMLPNLIYKTPKINFRPGREIAAPEIQQQALTIENDLNAIQIELDIARQYKAATKDALLLGNGGVKYGLTDTFGYDPEIYPFPAPFARRVSPWEFGIDPCCREQDMSDAEYIWFRMIVPLYKAKKDKSLKNPERIQPTSVSDFLPRHLREDAEQKKRLDAYEFAVLYELWNRSDNKFYVLDGDGAIYREGPWPYELYGEFPYANIGFTTIPDEFYCPGEPEYLELLQLEASEKRTQWLNHTRRFNRKYRLPPDVSPDDEAKLTEGGDGTCVRSREAIEPIADAPMPGDVSAELQMIMSEAREVTGISAYHRGGSEKGVATATEANIIGSAANLRVEERRLVVADAIAKGARILYNILRESKGWPQLPFDFTVDISTMKRPDDNEKRQDLMTFGQTAMQFPEFRRDAWLRDVALAFNKPPEQYVKTIQELQQEAQAQAQQPNPDQMKMQIEQAKAQAEIQRMQMDAQIEQQKAQISIQKMQAETELELQILRERLAFEREKMQLEHQGFVMKLQHEQASQQMKLDAARVDGEIKAETAKQDMTIKKASATQDMAIKKKQAASTAKSTKPKPKKEEK